MRKLIVYVAAIASAFSATSCNDEEPVFETDLLRNTNLKSELSIEEGYALAMYANAYANASEDYQSAANYLASAENSLARLIANRENFGALEEQIEVNNIDIAIERKNIERYMGYAGYRANYEELVSRSNALEAQCSLLYSTLKSLGSNKSTEYQTTYDQYNKAMSERDELNAEILAASFADKSIKNCERIIKAKQDVNEMLQTEIDAKSYWGGLRALRWVVIEYQKLADEAEDALIKAKQNYENFRNSLN